MASASALTWLVAAVMVSASVHWAAAAPSMRPRWLAGLKEGINGKIMEEKALNLNLFINKKMLMNFQYEFSALEFQQTNSASNGRIQQHSSSNPSSFSISPEEQELIDQELFKLFNLLK
jgi:hypothetical protein